MAACDSLPDPIGQGSFGLSKFPTVILTVIRSSSKRVVRLRRANGSNWGGRLPDGLEFCHPRS
ncbi:hypothetical protein RMSM_04921 [Rhodopirellula maiorica SM1]|uniref:Uncharacterized protein n=1 Tax=Rhodopirellula maiorica SM1 TaxID=1265738 RepID=M5RGA8_9BACT|nr:hypothetical protein RMSM_04921 [Rhodopirellula maiorica SM1]